MVGLARMEIVLNVYSQKPAWLQDQQVEQGRKSVQVIRYHHVGWDIAQRIKVT